MCLSIHLTFWKFTPRVCDSFSHEVIADTLLTISFLDVECAYLRMWDALYDSQCAQHTMLIIAPDNDTLLACHIWNHLCVKPLQAILIYGRDALIQKLSDNTEFLYGWYTVLIS